jgi:hypothetical protein
LDALTFAGIAEEFGDAPWGLCFGFHIGICNALVCTFTLPNHPLGVQHSEVIEAYYNEEEAVGHVSSCYSYVPLEFMIGLFQTLPLGVFFHPLEAKPHIIQDHSFPQNYHSLSSIDSQIHLCIFACDLYSFFDCYCLVTWVL